MTAPRLGFVLKGYPRLSESFIAAEIANLESRGFAIDIWSLRHPTDKLRHPVHERIKAPVTYLPEYLHHEPSRVLRATLIARSLKGFSTAWKMFSKDFALDPTRNRVRRFGQAMVLATEAPDAIRHFHAHFIHTPASVARYAALLTGRTWSFSAHAKDIFTIPDWEKSEKLNDALFGVTCTQAGAAHLNALGKPKFGPVALMMHGLDLSAFQQSATPPRSGPLRIVSVGRAVPKKGYASLLDALAAIPDEVDWTFEHIGGGTLMPRLKAQADELGLSSRITWRGAGAQSDVIDLLTRADVFVLASQNQPDGDRDGVPNVLLEAMAMAVPIVATHAGAIPEAITHDATGLLVAPGDSWGIARAITSLAIDEDKRQRLGKAALVHVHERFNSDPWADQLAKFMRRALPKDRP